MRIRNSNLLALFTASSVLSFGVILLSTYVGIQYVYHQDGIEAAKRQAINLSRAIYAHERAALTSDEPSRSTSLQVSQDDIPHLTRQMRAHIDPFDILKINVFDPEGRIVYSTDSAAIGQSESDNSNLQRALQGDVVAHWERQQEITSVDGQERSDIPIVETYLPAKTEAGRIIGAFEIYVNAARHEERLHNSLYASVSVIAAILIATFVVQFLVARSVTARLKEYDEQLQHLAATDGLTGLTNHRFALEKGQQEFERFKRLGSARDKRGSLACIMIDLDLFKRINDTWGHAAGDKILTDLAARISASLRPYDTLGRYGGEEFIVFAPDTDFREAKGLAERIWRTVREAPVCYQGQELNITVSVGVSSVQEGDKSIEQTIARADERLYEAKQLGRDRISP